LCTALAIGRLRPGNRRILHGLHRAHVVLRRVAQVQLAHSQPVHPGKLAEHALADTDLHGLPRVDLAHKAGVRIPIHAALRAGRIAAENPAPCAIPHIHRRHGWHVPRALKLDADLIVVRLRHDIAGSVRVEHQRDRGGPDAPVTAHHVGERIPDEEIGVGAHQMHGRIVEAAAAVAKPRAGHGIAHSHLLRPGILDAHIDIGVQRGRDGRTRHDQIARQHPEDARLNPTAGRPCHCLQILVAPAVAKDRLQPAPGTDLREHGGADFLSAARDRPQADLVEIAAIVLEPRRASADLEVVAHQASAGQGAAARRFPVDVERSVGSVIAHGHVRPAVLLHLGAAFDEIAVAAVKAEFGAVAKPVGCACLVFHKRPAGVGLAKHLFLRIDPGFNRHGRIAVEAHIGGVANGAGLIEGGAALRRSVGVEAGRLGRGRSHRTGRVDAPPSQDQDPSQHKHSQSTHASHRAPPICAAAPVTGTGASAYVLYVLPAVP